LLPAPAATRVFPTLSLQIYPVMPEPIPRQVPLSAFAWFFLSVFGLPHHSIGSTSRLVPRTRFSTGRLSRLQLFRYVQASQFARSQIVPTAASFLAGQPRLFTSEQNVRRCLRTHRICYPPDYRQLAERGLSPRKICSLVGCSRMMPTFPSPPLKVGSRSGAVSLRFRLPGAPRFLWEWTH